MGSISNTVNCTNQTTVQGNPSNRVSINHECDKGNLSSDIAFDENLSEWGDDWEYADLIPNWLVHYRTRPYHDK